MAYIGLPPKANFTSGLLDRFTSTTGTTVTLTNDISSENDIVVFVNFVKQDSTTYSVGGTGNKTLTLGGTLVSSDIVEVHYLNIVGQTVNPSANSVGSSQLTADSITGQTAETSIADDDTIIIHDTSASALRKMTKSNFVSGIGGTNTPSFFATNGSAQTIPNATLTKIEYPTEVFDTDSAYDNTNDKFVVPSGKAGKYFFHGAFKMGIDNDFNELRCVIYKNGSALYNTNTSHYHYESGIVTAVLDLSASDYVEIYGYQSKGTGENTLADSNSNYFMGFKLI